MTVKINNNAKNFKAVSTLVVMFIIGLFTMAKYDPQSVTASNIDRIKINNQAPCVKFSRPFKILHVMSYHSPWEWTDKQFEGFLADQH
jgi:hypothetical protein